MIDVHTLTDGGQTSLDIARRIAAFVDGAQETLELALYDIRLHDETAEVVKSALVGAHERGVNVRLVYNLDEDDDSPPVPVPPPPRTEPMLIESLPFPTAAIPGVPDLMHHKYVVRDGDAVWTGSTNWTDDSWTREENVIVTVESPELAARFQDGLRAALDDAQRRGVAARSTPRRSSRRREVRAWFCPGRGEKLAHRIAKAIGAGEAARADRVAGDHARRRSSARSRRSRPTARSTSPASSTRPRSTRCSQPVARERQRRRGRRRCCRRRSPARRSPASVRRRTRPGSVHDYMHAKVTVADDTVFVGSFNLSHSGELNAENVLEIADAALAERLAAFVDAIRAKYPALPLD